MSSDRSWMYRRIAERGGLTAEYKAGIEEFVIFASDSADRYGEILCPCVRCKNFFWKGLDTVRLHLRQYGFVDGYFRWVKHGEQGEPQKIIEPHENVVNEANYDVVEMLNDAYGPQNFDWTAYENSSNASADQEPNQRASDFYKILIDAGVPLYEGCEKHTKLTAVTKLLHFKNETGCSERGFNELLSLIDEFLPKDHTLPSTYYEVKKMVKSLNLGYEKIDSCENDCMLYYGDDKDKDECDFCNSPRYKTKKGGKNVPKKILRYFPITSRLQRLFMSSHTAEYMRWHKTRDTVDGQLTHPADGDEWKKFDLNFPSFAADARNVRLGLATDGFSPFNMGRQYSVWPVITVVYNLPPSMCMKDPYMFMTLLIPGPRSPRKDINVYLRPLVDELKLLWETGAHTYDKSLKQNFMMRAALLWTITDFPALGMISGWSTHGKLSCPVCMGDLRAFQLKHGKKPCYWGTTRKLLPPNHKFRKMTAQFNKHSEKGTVRSRMSGEDVLKWLKKLQFPPPGNHASTFRVADYGKLHNWSHFCMFFELPYWVTLNVRHCIDVMHTEKNVFDNLFYTVLDISGKSKDNSNARQDLELLGIRKELWLRGDIKPKAAYNLTKQNVQSLCRWLSALSLPDGYAANISRCAKGEQLKVIGLKSHDCHVFMQKLIPIAFRDMLPKNIEDAIIELSCFFRDLCSAHIRYPDIGLMEENIVVTMCKLEMIFPPSFFDSMEHILIHLPFELKFGGPVQYRWMYPFERYMGRLKRKVKNKARVEGSISEKYTEEELVNFCSLYFEEFLSTRHNRLGRNEVPIPYSVRDDDLAVFTYPVKTFGREETYHLNEDEVKKIGLYVLLNCPEVSDYITLFEDELREKRPNLTARQVDEIIASKFTAWFRKKLEEENKYERFKDVIRGPFTLVSYFKGCIVNGYRFKVDDVKELTSVNSGVVVLGSCWNDYESNYYGRLEQVIKLNYPGAKSVIIFKCRWFDTDKGVKTDNNRIVTVDVKSKLKSDDVFVLASQATQVYYASNITDPKSSWHTVVMTKTRSFDDANSSQMDIPVLQENVSDSTLVQITDQQVEQNIRDTSIVDELPTVDQFISVDDDDEEVEEEEEEENELSDGDESDESDGY